MNLRSTINMISNNKMPVLGLGTWDLGKETAHIVNRALKRGYPMIDASGNYGNQPAVGEGLDISGADRDDYFLVTKIENDEDAYRSLEENLDELGLEYADLTLIHWPPEEGAGVQMWQDLIKARRDGLTKDIGVSNYSTEEIDELIDATGFTPAVNQIEWTPFGHSDEMMDYCQRKGIIIQAYSPLTRGEKLDHRLLKRLSEKYDKTPAQILIRWNIQQNVVPVIKASNEQHLEQNIDVFDFNLSEEEMDELSNLNRNFSAIKSRPAYMH